MSTCISRVGEYSEHAAPDVSGPARFICSRCFVLDEDALMDALARAESTLAAVRDIHERWGNTEADDLDPLALWEDLGRLLSAGGADV